MSTWASATGIITTSQAVNAQFMFQELAETNALTWKLQMFQKSMTQLLAEIYFKTRNNTGFQNHAII